MKTYLKIAAWLTLLFSSAAIAQDTGTTTNAPATSGLEIKSQSKEERIKFLLEVASAYFKEDDFKSAISAYERVLEIDPEHQEARYVISHVYITAKEYAKAEQLLLELIEAYPENFQLLNNLAWLYATAEDPAFRDGKKGVKIAQKAMVLAPKDHHIWSTLAEAHYVCGDYEKAYEAITHMAKIATRYGSGITEEDVDSYNEQIRKCKRAMETQQALREETEK